MDCLGYSIFFFSMFNFILRYILFFVSWDYEFVCSFDSYFFKVHRLYGEWEACNHLKSVWYQTLIHSNEQVYSFKKVFVVATFWFYIMVLPYFQCYYISPYDFKSAMIYVFDNVLKSSIMLYKALIILVNNIWKLS